MQVGFIDYYLDEWHANNYPRMLKELTGGEVEVAYAYGQIPSPINPPAGCAFHERCAYACERCSRETPQQQDLGGGHMVSCLRADELKELL